MTVFVGLDVSKKNIDVCIIDESNINQFKIENNSSGINKFIEKLSFYSEVHCCCEYTNIYHIEIAEKLYKSNIKISVVNPYKLKSFSNMKSSRYKSDKLDAKLIAEFCQLNKPELWKPISKDLNLIKSIVKRINMLIKFRTMELNRQKVSDNIIKNDIQEHIDYINLKINNLSKELNEIINKNKEYEKIRDLLKSIPGIGEKTANILVSIFGQLDKFDSPKKLISYLGLSPMIKQSGSSIYKKYGISKMGDSFIRKSLYMPARVACLRVNVFKNWATSRMNKGKHPKQVYVMMMSKLVRYAYHIVKNNQPFNIEKLHLIRN